MTEQERFQRYIDLQEMMSSKGYKWLVRMFDEQIKEEQENFLRCESDQDRFKKQIRLQLLNNLKYWAEEEVSRCRSMEKMKR